MHVLLIDDDQAVRGLVRRILAARGFQVEEFENGVEAFAFFQTCPFEVDLVIVDKVMPDLGGIELLRMMCEVKPDLRALVSSGLPQESGDFAGLPETARVGYLPKPYSIGVLMETVEECLNS